MSDETQAPQFPEEPNTDPVQQDAPHTAPEDSPFTGRDVLGQPTSVGAPPPEPEPDTRELRIKGLHHITAICSNMERTVSFYRDLLGLTLLKQTTNDDDPSARHFYFGDPEASPGSMVTFLEYGGMEQGHVGVGMVHHFALRAGSLDELEAWHEHLKAHGVQSTDPINRTYFSSIYFRDPDGNIVEIATDSPGLVVD